MKEVEVRLGNLKFPMKCAVCNQDSKKSIASQCNVVRSAVPVPFAIFTTTDIVKINYPVCSSHYRIEKLASSLSERNMFYLMLGVLAVIFLLSGFAAIYHMINGKDVDIGTAVFFISYPMAYFCIYFWAKSRAPLRVTDYSDGRVKIVFKNEDFAKSVLEANHP